MNSTPLQATGAGAPAQRVGTHFPTVVLAGLVGLVVAFARLIDGLGFWMHGLVLSGLLTATWVVVQPPTSPVRLPVLGALILALAGISTIIALAQSSPITGIFRDATPLICLMLGLLIANSRLASTFLRVHILVASIPMALALVLARMSADFSHPLGLYEFRSGLPQYLTLVPIAGALLIERSTGLGRLLGFALAAITLLSYGRMETGLVLLLTVLSVVHLVRSRPALGFLLLPASIAIIGAAIATVLGGAGGDGGADRLAVDAADPSLLWRFVEAQAFLDWYAQADALALAFGEGLGSEVRLPGEILGFNDNATIPIFHTSYLTWTLKFGYLGVLLLLLALLKIGTDRRVRAVVGWRLQIMFVALLFGRGLVQHGLYEPHGLLLLGLLLGFARGPASATLR